MSNDFGEAARRFYRRHAENVDRAGDAVGANDTALSNLLWSASAALRRYADAFTENDEPPC